MSKDLLNPLSLDNQVCFSLYSATNAMVRAYRPLLTELDLTYPQYLVMLVLWENRGISVKTLGEQLHLDSGTLTPLLKRLEVKGLVIRGRSELDERVRVLHASKKGVDLKLLAAKIPEKMACKLTIKPEVFIELKRLCDQAYVSLADADMK
ncbi:MarR family transcriptional regulator [Shewanella hanedai]|jgi:DNA-binding MarR family transcriptional regulator|uniref:MarR family transcriptional regulator n=1 Tax=Shewanella hanedai TaxID=25 RepID=A0A553JKU8_SHEHA|nr:MarR family transcriptional regulator [Shewanella hanedai]TRY13084.1 MarR family transcriptional regulator [Shewanella hanedai]GGJ00450.1 MarR family transcriptional regulator [Shewanella hanedai]